MPKENKQEKPDLPMLKLRLKVKVPKAAYDYITNWAKDAGLEGTVEEALERGATQQFATLYMEAKQAKEPNKIIVPRQVGNG